ncbi:unnamed protein product [Lasius platythorax]|uniref:Uncharacterized protein n=1 Tax=Lasius platythorax TaxID=488582 RepID=A0AAV2N9X8_9HYME
MRDDELRRRWRGRAREEGRQRSSARFCTVVSARRHAVSAELIGAGNEVRDRGILITESNQFRETHEALATPRSLKEQSSYAAPGSPIPAVPSYTTSLAI